MHDRDTRRKAADTRGGHAKHIESRCRYTGHEKSKAADTREGHAKKRYRQDTESKAAAESRCRYTHSGPRAPAGLQRRAVKSYGHDRDTRRKAADTRGHTSGFAGTRRPAAQMHAHMCTHAHAHARMCTRAPRARACARMCVRGRAWACVRRFAGTEGSVGGCARACARADVDVCVQVQLSGADSD